MTQQFSDGEVLIARMLCDLMKGLKTQSELDPEFIEEALRSRYFWALGWKYPGLYTNSSSLPPEVDETSAILQMWRHLQTVFDGLDAAGKKAVLTGAGDDKSLFDFQGFDANNDPHYGIAHFLVNKMELFKDLRGADWNSHSRGSLDVYRRIRSEYTRRIQARQSGGLSADDLVAILNERIHPSNRKS